MKLVINEKLIKKNKTRGNIGTFSGLAVLAAGLFFACRGNTNEIIYSYIALFLGFFLTQVGIYYSSRFSRSPRFDQVLATAFEKLRHDYTFYVYTTSAPMVLLGPCSFWIVRPLTATGKISYLDGKWKQKGGNGFVRFMGQEGIGNPDKDTKELEDGLHTWLSEKGLPLDQQPPIKQVLVALLKTTELGDVSNAPIPVVNLEDVKRYIRHEDRENCLTPISEEELTRINALLEFKD